MLEGDVRLTLFSLPPKWHVLVTSECQENKASRTYVQFEEEKINHLEGLRDGETILWLEIDMTQKQSSTFYVNWT